MFDGDVWRYSPIGPFPTVIVGVMGLGLLVYVARAQSSRSRVVAYGLLLATVFAILALTTRGSLGNESGSFNWRLGESIAGELQSVNRELGVLNVFGNVLMFLPVGWLGAVLAPRFPVLVGGLAAAGLSVAVEISQMLSGSFGDIDDVALNSLGGVLGVVMAVVIQAVGTTARRNPAMGALSEGELGM